ncbi:response regulator transcription factor [Paenibacillus sp. OV219]|uniref:response regulator transcription factor n=1 Tax=Paenibacillus sp. OV219 TaxID=1884377 RepID=UPI0008AE00FA|nr:response regulator transcription factor [Paenibacillus sp. OV219]SEM58164.1 DNA-binding response regulator, OmpR family, contains REC and winged-helix (wHTH) domain [Paenibacillus sp. OV219]
MAKIAVVDDEAHIRELVKLYLNDEGFDIAEFANGEAAWNYLSTHQVDMVILDIMMPQMDGWELCRRIRASSDMPILMITAKGESEEKIKGFQLGTDDYMTKPFDPMELVVRVKALLRRFRITASQSVPIGRLVLDRASYQVIYKESGAAVTIPLKEFELLYKLASHPGQLYTRATLIEQIWGYEYEGDERTVDVHIKRLRERFSEEEAAFRIVTLRGLGYRLEVLHD